jgi:hypothetical protein
MDIKSLLGCVTWKISELFNSILHASHNFLKLWHRLKVRKNVNESLEWSELSRLALIAEFVSREAVSVALIRDTLVTIEMYRIRPLVDAFNLKLNLIAW